MPMTDVTQELKALRDGDDSAAERLAPLVMDELLRLARQYFQRERPDHTLQPTALVNETYLRLVRQREADWQSRTHFFAVAASLMRRILVDHARERARQKRGGDRSRVAFDEALTISRDRDLDVLAVNEALEKLAAVDERQARIVELRFFGGLTMDEVAMVLGVSKRTAEAEWTMIRAWLRRELSDAADSP